MGKFKCKKCKCFFNTEKQLEIHRETDCTTCDDCLKSFPSKERYDKHKNDDKCQPNICSFCQKKFLLKTNLDAHERTHTNDRPFPCTLCNQKFRTNQHLQSHVGSIHNGKPDNSVKCSSCKKMFTSQDELERHECQRAKGRNAANKKCGICGLLCASPAAFVDHMRVHTGEKTFKCPICDRQFARETNLTRHIGTLHMPKTNNIRCSSCKRKFSCQQDLDQHDCQRAKGFKGSRKKTCDECGKVCKNQFDLTVHVRVHTGEKPFKCPICEYQFAQKTNLTRHIGILHMPQTDNSVRRSSCKRKFSCQQDLDQHDCQRGKERKRPASNKKCEKCGQVYRNQFDLTTHMRVHTGEKPFKCPLCEYQVAHNSQLSRHLRQVHLNKSTAKQDEDDDEEYQQCPKCKVISTSQELQTHKCITCEWCFKYFPDVTALEQHKCQRRKCKYCGKKFPDSTKLKTHENIHTKEKPFKCELCDFESAEKSNLGKHIQLKHQKKSKAHENEEEQQRQRTGTCPRCKGKFTQQDFQQHKCNKCEWCLNYFPSRNALEQHKCKPKHCGFCGIKCRSACHLWQHERTHTDDKLVSSWRKKTLDPNSIIWACHYCDAILQCQESYTEHLKSHLRCKNCGRQFQKPYLFQKHGKICVRKCKYCQRVFFKTKTNLSTHQNKCKWRNDNKCAHCELVFVKKNKYLDHVRSFCPNRILNFKCFSCNSWEETDAVKVLEHVMTCKPQGKQKTFKCYICNHKFGKAFYSMHIQDELLNSNLFNDIPRDFKCTACAISYPTRQLLDLHFQVDHPCRHATLEQQKHDPEVLPGFDLTLENKAKLLEQRQRNWELDLNDFAFEGDLPLHRCCLCLYPFLSEGMKNGHQQMCAFTHGLDYLDLEDDETTTEKLLNSLRDKEQRNIAYLQRKNSTRVNKATKTPFTMKCKPDVVIEDEPTDFYNFSLWEFNGEEPELWCEMCHHPFFSESIKTVHERQCQTVATRPHPHLQRVDKAPQIDPDCIIIDVVDKKKSRGKPCLVLVE